MTKPLIQDEIENAFQFLNEYGYSPRRYDIGPEFGVEYNSSKRNRSINLMLPAYIDGGIACTFRRKYFRWYVPLMSDSNRRKCFVVEREFQNDQEFLSLPKTSSETNLSQMIHKYAMFLEKRLHGVIAGEEWIDETISSKPAA